MPNIRDFSDDNYFDKWAMRYTTSIDKKFYPQGDKIYILRKRTSNTAIEIVDHLRKIPLNTIQLHLTIYVDGEETYPDLLTKFEKELLLAKKNPESFADGLFTFYRQIAKYIKSNNLMELFFGLLAFVEDHLFLDQTGDDFSIYSVFMDLLLQQMEFLRESPLDYLKVLAGVTTDESQTIEVDDPYPIIDLPLYKLIMEAKAGRLTSTPSYLRFLQTEFEKIGYKGVRSLDDYSALNASSRIFISNVNTMAGFINEYTFDMLTQNPLKVGYSAIHAPKMKSDYGSGGGTEDVLVDTYAASTPEQRLTILANHRHRTLPRNGIQIQFGDSSLYRTLTLKEIFRFGDLYLLYRLTTKEGDISGRYNTRMGRFVSPLNSVVPRPDDFISALKGLVLWAYTAVTCDDSIVRPTNESYHRIFDDFGASVTFLSLGNRLQRSYGSNATSSVPLDLEKYESKEISLNGYIRKLPENQKASERAQELAMLAGFELSDGETYVQPFIRHAWTLRDKSEKGD